MTRCRGDKKYSEGMTHGCMSEAPQSSDLPLSATATRAKLCYILFEDLRPGSCFICWQLSTQRLRKSLWQQFTLQPRSSTARAASLPPPPTAGRVCHMAKSSHMSGNCRPTAASACGVQRFLSLSGPARTGAKATRFQVTTAADSMAADAVGRLALSKPMLHDVKHAQSVTLAHWLTSSGRVRWRGLSAAYFSRSNQCQVFLNVLGVHEDASSTDLLVRQDDARR